MNKKSHRPVITYKSVIQLTSDNFAEWANEAWEKYGVKNLVLVGSPSSEHKILLPLPSAYKALVNHSYDFFIGVITIAERHASKKDEHKRLILKHQQA